MSEDKSKNRKNPTAHFGKTEAATRRRRSSKHPTVSLFRRPIVCPPDGAGRGLRTRIFGYLARAIVLLFAVFGFSFFITDTFRFHYTVVETSYLGAPVSTDYGVTGTVFLAALVSVALLSVICIFRRARIVGATAAGVGAVAVAVLAACLPQFRDAIRAVAASGYNEALERLHAVDFLTLIPLFDVADAGLSEEFRVKAAAVLLTALISLLFVPFLIRKTRMLPPCIFAAAVLTFIFACNISRSNWAFVLMLSSFCAVIVMGAYDKLYLRKPRGEAYDTTASLFPGGDRPTLPDEVLERKLRKAEARERRKELRVRRKAERKVAKKTKKSAPSVTVDEELKDYYFADSNSRNTRKPKKERSAAVRLTPAEKAANKRARLLARQEKREADRRVRKGIAAVRAYDSVTEDSRAASGGFAALVAFVLLFLLLLIPAITVKGKFKTIPAIDDRLAFCREYLTALLVGNEDILDKLDYEKDGENFDPHSTELKDRYYNGTPLFYVRSKAHSNIYLRNWIATDFRDGNWHAVSDEQLNAYREMFLLQDYPAEEIRTQFYRYMFTEEIPDPLDEEIDWTTQTAYFPNYGTVLEEVRVRRLSNVLGSSVYLPSVYVSAYGFHTFDGSSPSDLNFINYYDGILTGRDFADEDVEHSSLAHVTTMKDENFIYHVSDKIVEYQVNKKLCELYDSGYFTSPAVNPNVKIVYEPRYGGNNYAAFYEPLGAVVQIQYNKAAEIEFVAVTGKNELPSTALFDAYVRLMTKAEKAELNEIYDTYDDYRAFVYDTYTSVGRTTQADGTLKASTLLGELSETIKAEISASGSPATAEGGSFDPATYEERHAFVLAIVDYMKENCTYISYNEDTFDVVIDPETIVADENLDAVENFLTVTKQGYCVQFASALCLLLREQGIPARYVEGYVVNNQTRDRNLRDVVFHGTVRDYNFHAWVEVWFDGIGWVQYEATPGEYYEDMYPTEDSAPDDKDPTDDPSEDEIPEEEEPEEETPDEMTEEEKLEMEEALRRAKLFRVLAAVGAVTLILLVITFLVILIAVLASRKEKGRDRFIERVKTGAFSDKERRTVALKLIDDVNALIMIYRLLPLPGELREAYADRMLDVMPSVFGIVPRAEGDDRVSPLALIEPIDAQKLFLSIASEEFGHGMTRDEMKTLAEFYRRLRTQKKRFVPLGRRFFLHYFGRKL